MRQWVIVGLVGIGLLLAFPRKVWALPAKGLKYATLFQQAEYQNGLPSRLLARQAKQESNYDPGAYNRASGARGMMQIIPRWHPNVNVSDLDPTDDIFYAGKYMRENYNAFGTWARALAAYNWGPGNVRTAIRANPSRWLDTAPKETRNYVYDILGDLGIGVA